MAPRTGTRRGTAAAPKAAPATSFRGAAGLRRMKEEEQKAEVRKAAAQASMKEPFRFYVKPTESASIIIVDEAPDFFRMEHALQNPRTKRFNLFVPCIDEHTNCPACAVSDKPAYFAMYLTVIDLTPYEKDGHEVEWSKKMMVVKATQQKKIMRLYEKHGTLRGMELLMTRDGDMDAAIGNDIEFQGFVPEEELLEYVTEYTDRERKVHEVIGDEPFDYEDIYPDMGEDEIKAVVGGRASSRDDDDDYAPASRRAAPARASRRPAAEEEEEEEAAPPRRAARTAAKSAAPTRASRRPAAEEEEEEEEEAPRRTTRAGSKAAAPTRTARRPAEEAEEEEEEEAPRRPARTARRPAAEEEAPQRPARRPAARREEPEEEEEEEEAPASSRQSRRANLRPTRR